jgi:hypothetical protein
MIDPMHLLGTTINFIPLHAHTHLPCINDTHLSHEDYLLSIRHNLNKLLYLLDKPAGFVHPTSQAGNGLFLFPSSLLMHVHEQ